MISPQPDLTAANAIGERLSAIRQRYGITRDALARQGSVFGVTWGRTSVENMEAGRFSPTVPTLYVLCRALSALLPEGREVRLLDLFPESGHIEIAPGFSISAPRLRGFLGDTESLVEIVDGTDELARILAGPPPRATLSEQRAAKKLGVRVEELRDVAFELWMGESLDQVVSASLDSGAPAQARGHETRRRVEELRRAFEQRRSDG